MVQSIAAHYAPDLLSQEELESLAWEGALRAFRTYDSKKGTALKSWIFTKANGAIKDALRKEQSRREHEAQGSVSFFEACLADRNADNSEADSYCKKIVQDALETLDGRTREIIRRRFFDGETQAKIAASVGISQSWCSRLYKRGMEQLKNEILRLNAR